jgi:hypothetical protein
MYFMQISAEKVQIENTSLPSSDETTIYKNQHRQVNRGNNSSQSREYY